MTRFGLTIEYDGRNFVGWQRQMNGASIQGAIEAAILAITGETVDVYGAGRTDAGVHARAMVAHVDIDHAMTPFRLMQAINARLFPAPVAISACAIVASEFHARFDCVARSYTYRIINRRAPLTFDRGLAWRVPQPLDTDAMAAAAQKLVGRHDFTTFRSARCQSASPVKTLDQLTVRREGESVWIDAHARSFLHHQVRSMVGCLKLVGQGYWTQAQLEAALLARDRAALGYNAPPDGLTFVSAHYAQPKPSICQESLHI
ncbi:MAG: tRNA pseudouridine(38-40) synthase TruA [Polymorphobacter sp.]